MFEFHFQRQLKSSFFVSYHTKCFSANYKQLCWTLDKLHRNAFSWLAKGLQQFLCLKPCCWAIPEKYRRWQWFLCVAAISVLLFSNKATVCISSIQDLIAKQSHLWYLWLILLSMKMLHLTYPAIMCEAKFCKDFRFSSALESSTYLKLS